MNGYAPATARFYHVGKLRIEFKIPPPPQLNSIFINWGGDALIILAVPGAAYDSKKLMKLNSEEIKINNLTN